MGYPKLPAYKPTPPIRKTQKVRLPYNYFRVQSLQPVNKANVTLRSTIGKRHAPVKEVTKQSRYGNKIVTTTKSSRVTPSGLVQRASSQRVIIKKAKHGYHGIVTKPTRFLVGEAGREHVDIYPVRRRQKKIGMLDDFDFTGGLRAGDFF